MEEIIKTEMLTKIYNPFSKNPKLALDEVSLSIKEGEFYQFYGEKWLRKTTLLNVLSQLMILQKKIVYLWQKYI